MFVAFTKLIFFPGIYRQVKHDVEDDGLMECIDQFGVELPTGLFFGLSAQTGDLSGWFIVNNKGLRTT